MDEKKTKQLFKKYKKLFPKKDRKNAMQSLMCFGFECGNGWYNIIDKLCSCIQNYITGNELEQVIVTQVKEKFGGLRFYAHNTDDLIEGMIWFAEYLSRRTCEECGEPGKRREIRMWVRTLCDKCYKEEVKKWKQ